MQQQGQLLQLQRYAISLTTHLLPESEVGVAMRARAGANPSILVAHLRKGRGYYVKEPGFFLVPQHALLAPLRYALADGMLLEGFGDYYRRGRLVDDVVTFEAVPDGEFVAIISGKAHQGPPFGVELPVRVSAGEVTVAGPLARFEVPATLPITPVIGEPN